MKTKRRYKDDPCTSYLFIRQSTDNNFRFSTHPAVVFVSIRSDLFGLLQTEGRHFCAEAAKCIPANCNPLTRATLGLFCGEEMKLLFWFQKVSPSRTKLTYVFVKGKL